MSTRCGKHNYEECFACESCLNEAKKEAVKEVFEEQLGYIEKELRLIYRKQKMEKDNVIWKQDEGNLKEWRSFIEKQKKERDSA